MKLLKIIILLGSFGLRAASEKVDYDRMLEAAILNGDVKAAEAAIAHGANVNGLGFEQPITRLNLAISQNQYEIADCLLKAGANVNLTHGYSDSPPLSVALFYKRFDLAQLLLKYKADVNQIGSNERTTPIIALVKSTFENNHNVVPIIKQLIFLKANINFQDRHGWHALDYAVLRRTNLIVYELLKLNAQIDKNIKFKQSDGLFYDVKHTVSHLEDLPRVINYDKIILSIILN